MRFEWFVAQRYLRSPYRPAVLRLVTLFSMVGVAAGVATLVIALSMNTGFRETLQDRLLGVTAHVSLTRPGSSGIKNYGEMATKLAEEWKVSPGDYVTLTSPQGRLTPFGLMPRTRRFRVAGVFDSGFYDYDE